MQRETAKIEMKTKQKGNYAAVKLWLSQCPKEFR